MIIWFKEFGFVCFRIALLMLLNHFVFDVKDDSVFINAAITILLVELVEYKVKCKQ